MAENRWNDCLPTSLAAALEWFGLGRYAPDALKDAVYGDVYKGYTTVTRFIPLLADLGVRLRSTSPEDAREAVQDALRQGRAVVALSYEPEGFYHYCPVIGLDAETVTRHNPLGGKRETLSWRDWLYRYAGELGILEKN